MNLNLYEFMKKFNDSLVAAKKYGFLIEPAYFEQGLHDDPIVRVRQTVLEILEKARKTLPKNWNFKIWDGFRTTVVQQRLYDDLYKKLVQENPEWTHEKLHESVLGFVAEPTKDPLVAAPHNTGGAVDLTIVDENEEELSMGTAFDHFDKESYTFHFQNAAPGTPEYDFHKNRMILYEVLVPLGFFNYPDEWWHFSYGDKEWAKHYDKQILYKSAE